DGGGAGLVAAGDEGVGVSLAADVDPVPGVLGDEDGGGVDVGVAVDEVAAEGPGEAFDVGQRVVAGDGVDGVLHRVGRDDFRVVAVGVGGLEGAFELDVDGELLELVDVGAAGDLGQADLGLAVGVLGEDAGGHGG